MHIFILCLELCSTIVTILPQVLARTATLACMPMALASSGSQEVAQSALQKLPLAKASTRQSYAQSS